MSYYELASMLVELDKDNKKTTKEVTDDEWAEAQEMILSVTLNDPTVRI